MGVFVGGRILFLGRDLGYKIRLYLGRIDSESFESRWDFLRGSDGSREGEVGRGVDGMY